MTYHFSPIPNFYLFDFYHALTRMLFRFAIVCLKVINFPYQINTPELIL